MKKLVQINVSLNWGSTGKIAEGIALIAKQQGWSCYTVHGQRFQLSSEFPSFQVSSKLEEMVHYAQSVFLDKQGLGSTRATKRLVKQLEIIEPDILHLHVIHGCFINYQILFEYIKKNNIPVLWTLHDCWAFTGHCVYFDRIGCNKWKTGCLKCPQLNEFPKSFIDGSTRNYLLKKSIYSDYKDLTIVPVSQWLGKLVKESFLRNLPIHVIHNGIDLNRFKASNKDVRLKYLIDSNKHIILGVANGFGERKGIGDFAKLSEKLPNNCQIVLVGIMEKDKKWLNSSIRAIERTDSQQDLIDLYTSAAVFINPTYEDNFPTTNLESLACGTPVITYDTGGSPEAIDNQTGIVVKQGDIEDLKNAIVEVVSFGKDHYSIMCRKRAENFFNQKDRFEEYVSLYDTIIQKKNK